MPPLIRRKPLSERLKDYLNPYDLLLWLSEELHESALEEALQDWALPIGAGANLIFIIARANSGLSNTARRDDVFGDFDGRGGSGWLGWFASFTAHLLALLAVMNAVYTFTRTRHYRLFEAAVDEAPSTPSAHRVRVDSSPTTASPLRYIRTKLQEATAQARAYPDEHRDVWEIRLWDPKDLNLELFTLFSPGHVMIYWLFLPTTALDPRPSVTVVTSIIICALLSLQLVALRKFFLQQAKDARIINKEVMNEYDTKFVHPNLNKPVRDVGVQTRESTAGARTRTREVDVYTPTTIINRGFQVNPNPSYTSHLGEDADSLLDSPSAHRLPRSGTAPLLRTPSHGQAKSYTAFGTQPEQPAKYASPVRQYPPSQSQQRPSSPMKGDGGSLGVYSHAASPLKKAASVGHLRPGSSGGYTSSRIGSPLKRISTPGEVTSRERLGLGSGTSTGQSSGTSSDRLNHRFQNLREQRRETGRF
ncbi:hypothetical protein MBLNU457_6542t1 [Dothideomycetes sp. NU457]